jgi:outer membrane protein
MKIKIISFAMLFFSATAFAQETKMTLKQCIDSAIKNNILVKQFGLQTDAAAINLTQAKTNLLPNLNGSFGYGFNQGRNVDPLTNSFINQQLQSSNVGLNSSIVLFNGMRLQNLIKQNSYTSEAAKMDLQQTKNNLTLNVILAYLQVLNNEDILAISKAQTLVTKKQIERMEILVKEGVSANYLLADLKGQLANEEISIINSINTLQQSKLSICQLMNIDYNAELQLDKTDAVLPTNVYETNAAEIYQASLQNFASIKANAYKIKSAEKAIKISKSAFLPSISLTGNLSSSYSSLAQTLNPTNVTEGETGAYVILGGNQNPVLRKQQNFAASKTAYTNQLNNNLGSFIGISVQIPIFNGFQTKNNIKLTQVSLKNIQLESDNIKALLKQNIEQAYLNMTASYNRLQVLKEQVINFEESFRAAEVRFNNGVINSAEYLVSKNNLDRTKVNHLQATYEYNFRTKLLDFYKGVK